VSGTLDQQRQRAAWWFLTPTLVVLALVALWPLVRTIGLSFTDAHLGTRSAPNFVGLANYVETWSSPAFRGAVRNTLYFVLVGGPLSVALSLGAALLLNARLVLFRGLFRTKFFQKRLFFIGFRLALKPNPRF